MIIYARSKTSEHGNILILLGNGKIDNNNNLGEWNKIFFIRHSFLMLEIVMEKNKTEIHFTNFQCTAFGERKMYLCFQIVYFLSSLTKLAFFLIVKATILILSSFCHFTCFRKTVADKIM